MPRLGVCAIFKDEARYLREWVLHHRLIGFDGMVLYDNGSTDGSARELARPDLQPGLAVVPWPERPGQQSAYAHFARHFAHQFDWVAFIDVDEFIHPLDGWSIRSCLRAAGAHSAVLVHWLNFGPGQHIEEYPIGLVTEHYDRRLPEPDPWHGHVKSLVRTADLAGCDTPHTASLRGPACNARGETVANVAVQPTACHDRLVINHYYTKCWPGWREKVARRRVSTDDPALQRTQAMFDYHQANATVLDRRIQALVPDLRRSFYGAAAT